MKAFIRIVGQNFSTGYPYVLYDGYTWDEVAGHAGVPIQGTSVEVSADDNDLDIRKNVIDAAAAELSLAKRDVVLY